MTVRLLFIALAFMAIPAGAADLTGTFASGKAPYFWTEGAAAKGIELDIVGAVLRRAGYEIHPRALPNNRVTGTFTDADIDFATGLQQGDLEGYCHTGIYMAYHNIAVTKRSHHIALDGTDSLMRYRVAIRQSLYQDLTLDKRGGALPPAMPSNFKEFVGQDQQVRFFFADRADVIILDRLIFHWYAQRLGLLPADEAAMEIHDIFPAPHGVRAVFK